MNTLVVGASGATGKLLVNQLLSAGQKVKIIVRSTFILPENWENNTHLTVIYCNIIELTVEKISEIMADCQSVASCLGHNLTWKGIFGKPRRLVADTVELICEAIIKNSSSRPTRFVLMNTAGNSNRDVDEPISVGQKIVIGLLRILIPPHPDNEKAGDYLRKQIGQTSKHIQWVVVRPDTLINEEDVSEYSLHRSPTRSAIFNPGKTSRINVGNFMARLLTNDDLWSEWKGQMPVIYNANKQVK